MKIKKSTQILKKLLIFFICLYAESFSFGQTSTVIAVQPRSQYACNGQAASFNVTAEGATAGYTYQWYKDNVLLPSENGKQLNINLVTLASVGAYTVVVQSQSSNPLITYSPTTSQIAYLNIPIVTYPVAVKVAAGSSATFSVTATNATNYQWKNSAGNITGAVQSTYTPTNIIANDLISVIVSNSSNTTPACGADTTTPVALTVVNDLYLISNAIDISVLTNWTVNSDRSVGSSPVNFTTPTYIFNVSSTAVTSAGRNALLPASSFTMAGTLKLSSSGVLEIAKATTFTIDNISRLTGSGYLSGHYNSSLYVNGNADLYFVADSSILQNLTLAGSGTSTLQNGLNIAPSGTLVVNTGTFSIGGFLTLKSDATGTAAIGTSSGTVSGKVIIERYIPARRAWRVITAPVSSIGAPTINAAWQEGGTNSKSNPIVNNYPNYGTQISGGNTSKGFDTSVNINATLKTYSSNNTLGSIANTNNTLVTAYPGYFFFIRGDRSKDLLKSYPGEAGTKTTLRTIGNINQGTITSTATIGAYSLVGNPYASPIDFTGVSAQSLNIQNRFYYWNPQLGGTSGLGAYVLVDFGNGAYTSTPQSGTPTPGGNIIQSGEAIFVQNTNPLSNASVTIKEANKTLNSNNSNVPFGRVATTNTNREAGQSDPTISIDLKIVNPDSSLSVADGVLAYFNDSYSNDFNNDDAAKFYNGAENILIDNPQQALTIERRKMPQVGDTLALKISNYKNASYQFSIKSNFSNTGLQTELVDKFLNKLMPLADTATYTFSITSDANSSAANRFSIVYKSTTVLPIKFLTLTATVFNADSINIFWKVAEDVNTLRYEIQRLNENNVYTTIGQINSNTNSSIAGYYFNDIGLFASTIFYRIKAINISGEAFYSTVVSVKLKSVKDGISIWPNPVTGNTIKLAMQNIKEGKYSYSVINNAGQAISSGTIIHNSSQPIITININELAAEGNYIFYLKQKNTAYQTKLVITKGR